MQQVGNHIHVQNFVYHKSEIPNIVSEYDARAAAELARETDDQSRLTADIASSQAFRALAAATDWATAWNLFDSHHLLQATPADKKALLDKSLQREPRAPTIDNVLAVYQLYFVLSPAGVHVADIRARQIGLAHRKRTFNPSLDEQTKILAMLPKYSSKHYSVRELRWLDDDFRQWADNIEGASSPAIRDLPFVHGLQVRELPRPDLVELDRIVQSRNKDVRRPQWRKWWIHRYRLTDSDIHAESRLRDLFGGLGFYMRHYPATLVSKDLPCRLEELVERTRLLDLLGVYHPRARRIVLYDRLLKYWSEQLGVEFEALKAVVFAHEIGHWIAHALPHPLAESWPTSRFCESEVAVKEGHAQLFCHWAIRNNPVLLNAFDTLLVGQGPEYHVFKTYLNDPQEVVIRHLLSMRKRSSPATQADWPH